MNWFCKERDLIILIKDNKDFEDIEDTEENDKKKDKDFNNKIIRMIIKVYYINNIDSNVKKN